MHIFLKSPNLTKCPKCGNPTLPHVVCLNCGYYKEREMVNVLKKLTKRERKKKEKEIKTEEKEKGRGKSLSLRELSRK